MKKCQINIKQPNGDSFGASFQQLLPVLDRYNSVINEDCSITFNLKKVKFVHPFLVLPVAALVQETIDKEKFDGFDSCISDYLDILAFPSGIIASEDEEIQSLFDGYRKRTYLPICAFPTGLKSDSIAIRDNLINSFNRLLAFQMAVSGAMRSVLSYLITEAIDNIVEHAKCEKGWIMAQYYPNKGYLDLCICDLGIGLLNSYVSSGKYPEINTHETALQEAIHGKSTKNIPENRGFGLSTSRTMLVEGLKGKYFMYSGNSFYVWTDITEQITQTPNNILFPGTMISMRIPQAIPEGFDIFDFVS